MAEEPKKPNHSHGKSLWGAGWGGPANGPGNARPKGSRAKLSPEMREMQDQLRAERREQILQMFLDVASDTAQPGMARITAGDRYLDRTEGKAVQAVVNHDGGEKSLEDLIVESMKKPEESAKI